MIATISGGRRLDSQEDFCTSCHHYTKYHTEGGCKQRWCPCKVSRAVLEAGDYADVPVKDLFLEEREPFTGRDPDDKTPA